MIILNYVEIIDKQRKEKDDYFRDPHYSPLTEEQQGKFTGLKYFDVNEKFRFVVQLQEYSVQQEVDIRTSNGTIQRYIRHSYVSFEVDGVESTLTVYLQPNSDYLFVPFKDKTSGSDTYGAGRYIELERSGKNQYILDFNTAYNPYCAYNDEWTCPLTPFENILQVEIRAGEKKFK